MIKLSATLDNTSEVLEDAILMTNGEAGARGEAVVVTAGRLTKCAATAKPEYILAMDTAAGTNVKTLYSKVREDNIYEADITGAGTINVGLTVGTLDANGTGINAAVQTGGVVKVIAVDQVKKKAKIRF